MKFTFKASGIQGKGMFATENIKRGEAIKVLTGERVSKEEISKRITEHRERADDPLQIGDSAFLDLNEDSILINHSCSPNAGIRRESELFAMRAIAKGEEITFDYSTTVGKDLPWTMSCSCSATDCRKQIGNVLTIPKEKLRAYAKLGALPDFIRNQIKDLPWTTSASLP